LWVRTTDAQHRQGGRVGNDNHLSHSHRAASDSPTPTAARSSPPHEGEGGGT
jgi:hypothetical protein